MSGIHITSDVAIAEHELVWRFSPSGGPGGQHANRSSTRAEVSIDIAGSPSIPGDLRDRILSKLGKRAAGGVVTVVADDTRSQWRNRVIARRRISELLVGAARQQKPRRPSRPTRASTERQRENKRARSVLKESRRRPDPE